jgi:hypothetical protein
MNDTDDTRQATSGAEPETVIVPPETAVAELAWSQDTEELPAERRSWTDMRIVLAGAAALVAVAGASLWAWHEIGKHRSGATPTASTNVTTVIVAPPPVTVTAAPQPIPTTSQARTPQDRDARFLALVAAQHLPPKYADQLTPQSAQADCRVLEDGLETKASDVTNILHNAGGDLSPEQAMFIVNTEVSMYCPQYNND